MIRIFDRFLGSIDVDPEDGHGRGTVELGEHAVRLEVDLDPVPTAGEATDLLPCSPAELVVRVEDLMNAEGAAALEAYLDEVSDTLNDEEWAAILGAESPQDAGARARAVRPVALHVERPGTDSNPITLDLGLGDGVSELVMSLAFDADGHPTGATIQD